MKILIATILLLVSNVIHASSNADFVITVKTDNPGAGTVNDFIIDTDGSIGYTYNYNVDCNNDGTYEVVGHASDYTCSYFAAGTYTIRIRGNTSIGEGFPAFRVGTGSNSVSEKLLTVEQWGAGRWRDMNNAFRDASNLVINATDVPDFSYVTNMHKMFQGATSVNPDTSNWDTSLVTVMASMFSGATSANPDTSNWDTSSVTSMFGMFDGATSANPDTSQWDTSSVTSMTRMFYGATSTNPDTSNWDVSGVTSMTLMFSGVTLPTPSYDQILISFSAQNLQSNVNFHAGYNSRYCSAAAQAARASIIANYNWDITDGGVCDPADDFVIRIKSDNPGGNPTEFVIHTANGIDYNYNVDCNNDGTFEAYTQTGNYTCDYGTMGAGIYTIRIQDNTGVGTGYTRPMFSFSNVREKILSVDNWGTMQWTNMGAAFWNCSNLVMNATDTPNFSNVTSMANMFRGAVLANPITAAFWDTSSVTNMSSMFRGAISATPIVGSWDTSSVINMPSMFRNATSASPVIRFWDVSSVTNMAFMFDGISLSTLQYDATLINFSTQNLKSNVNFHAGYSQYCSSAAQAARATIISSNGWNITDGGLCGSPDDFVISIKSDNPGGNSTEFVIETAGTSYNYNVDCNDDGIFEAFAQTGNYICDYNSSGAGVYNIRIRDNSGNGTGYTKAMFSSASVNKKLLSIEQWGTMLWTDMFAAFLDCSNLVINATDIPDFSNVTSMAGMFQSAALVNPDTSSWDISSVTDIRAMFFSATSANPDVSNWDTSNVTDMRFMFAGATAASPVISTWDVSSVTNMTSMFDSIALPTSEYDAALINFSTQNLQSNVNFDAGNSQYCSAAALAARASIITNYNWAITDGGICPANAEIFTDGFESTVVVFKTAQAQFAFDFSDVALLPDNETPKLIATGVDREKQINVKIYLRQLDGVLEMMQSQRLEDFDGEQVWDDGLWYEVFEQGLSEVVLW